MNFTLDELIDFVVNDDDGYYISAAQAVDFVVDFAASKNVTISADELLTRWNEAHGFAYLNE